MDAKYFRVTLVRIDIRHWPFASLDLAVRSQSVANQTPMSLEIRLCEERLSRIVSCLTDGYALTRKVKDSVIAKMPNKSFRVMTTCGSRC